MMQKNDPLLMALLSTCAKNRADPERDEAKSIQKKIETSLKLTVKEEKWLSDFSKKKRNQPFLRSSDLEDYQVDQSDMVSPEEAIETYCKDAKPQYDRKKLDSFFLIEATEDIAAESAKRYEIVQEHLTAASASMDLKGITHWLAEAQKEKNIQEKNTTVRVYSLGFPTIHTEPELQAHVARCERVLLRQFFHAHFLPGQLQSILCALTKACDCVVSMRTGGGKTMIFAIPALLEANKTTVVFIPLRSLIFDQMNEMAKLGIAADYLMSETEMSKSGGSTRSEVLKRLQNDELRVLFTTPEQAFSNSCMPFFKEMIAQNKISRIVVDEAHLLRQWESFRKQFQSFGQLRSCFPGVPMILMTACLPHATRSFLGGQIGFTHVMMNRMQANRCNAFYLVSRKFCNMHDASCPGIKGDSYRKIRGPAVDQLVALLKGAFCGASAIIYCRTAKQTGNLSDYLNENVCVGVARHFHAQMAQEERVGNQKLWTDSTVPVMVATCAFGLGINHPHVRLIVHWDMPQTLDDYFQQAGRAGRDGAPCLILSFYHPTDIDGLLNLGVSYPEKTVEVARFMENQIFCRRALVLSEYAEPCPPRRCGTSCDVCYYQKTWSLYDISRFANNLLALVWALPHQLEPLDVKRDPFKWLISLLCFDDKAIKSIISSKDAASLCKPGILPGCGSMKNIGKDDAYTILLSLFEHGVFKIIQQESKQFGKGLQSHTWKIVPGDDVLDVSKNKRLLEPRYTNPMLIPLPTATISRLQRPVGGLWEDNPDHALWCAWCKDSRSTFKESISLDEVRRYPCAPILAHKECIDDEHDDEENRQAYDDPETCILCRCNDLFQEGSKRKRQEKEVERLIICSHCHKSTCYTCLKDLYELGEDTISKLTSLESAAWSCANCNPFTVPMCYQWSCAEIFLKDSGKHKSTRFCPQDDFPDLLSALLDLKAPEQCELALQFSEKRLRYMEEDLMPLEAGPKGEFPLFSFVSENAPVDTTVQHYYMVMSHSSGGLFLYAVEFVVNSRSNALQPKLPSSHDLKDLFDEKCLLRFAYTQIKQIHVDTKQYNKPDGTSNVWCAVNTINKIRRDLLAKIKAKQRYKWTRLRGVSESSSDISIDPKCLSSSGILPPNSKAKVHPPKDDIVVEVTNKRKVIGESCKPLRVGIDSSKDLSSPLMKRPAAIEASSSLSKVQKLAEIPSATSKTPLKYSKPEEAEEALHSILHSINTDKHYFFTRKDASFSFQPLMVSMLSHANSVIPIDPNALRLSQQCLTGNEYGGFSLYHVIFLALYEAHLPIRSEDIALIIQSMGFTMSLNNSSSTHLSSVIQNTLLKHYDEFKGGIFQCNKQFWFLNPKSSYWQVRDRATVKKSSASRGSLVHTASAGFGLRNNVFPGTFLKVKDLKDKEVKDLKDKEEDLYCMVTTNRDGDNWYREKENEDGLEPIREILVRWFVEPKPKGKTVHGAKDLPKGKTVHGAKELYALEGGTDEAWGWYDIDLILEVIFVKWGEPEAHEAGWFDFYYTKNVNTFTVDSGSGKKSSQEHCISPCNPMQFLIDFWPKVEDKMLEFRNPDPYESNVCVDETRPYRQLFHKLLLPSMPLETPEKHLDWTPATEPNRTHLNLICARNLMSRHYPHPRNTVTKSNVRSCHNLAVVDLFETVIFVLLENQSPMPFKAMCQKIGALSDICVDVNNLAKALPDIFWVDVLIDANGQKSKDEYISLKIWEVTLTALQTSFECKADPSAVAGGGKSGREGISWKRAHEAVSKQEPRASVLRKCALISQMYPALCEHHMSHGAPAAYCLNELASVIALDSLFPLETSPIDQEVLKVLKWGVVFRDIATTRTKDHLNAGQHTKESTFEAPRLELEASAAPATVDRITVVDSDDSIYVVDSDDDDSFEPPLLQKRALELKPEVLQSLPCQTDPCHQFAKQIGPDNYIGFQFALVFCLQSLQSNLIFQLHSVRDKISKLGLECKSVMMVVEQAAVSLQERNILIYDSTAGKNECDPSPCFRHNIERGLVISVSNGVEALVHVEKVVDVDEKLTQFFPKKSKVPDAKPPKIRSVFSFVAPPRCSSFQDKEVFLRSAAHSNEVASVIVSQFTSMYSHFSNREEAYLHLMDIDEDQNNHASRIQVHPIVELVRGKRFQPEQSEKDDDIELDFDEPLPLRQDADENPEAFKPFCDPPDPNIPDYRKKFEIFTKLDFEVAYSIEHYIASGGLSWNALDHQDLVTLEKYSEELVEARKTSFVLKGCHKIQDILNKIKVQLSNKVNMEKMKLQIVIDKEEAKAIVPTKKQNERKKIVSDDIQVMERCTVFSGVFHSGYKRGVQLKPSAYGKFSCRAYRKFGSDRFITVTIPRGSSTSDVQCLLNYGFKTIVGDRLYRFIPSGDSHLKERKLMFFAVSGKQLEPILPQQFLSWHIPVAYDPKSKYFENSEIISIKFFSRFQLCFSASAVAMTLSPEEFEYIDDIELEIPGGSKKVCATDGCGRAPPKFFEKIRDAFKLNYAPSCVQIRFGGCKGLLHVDTSVSKVQFRRKSQRKYVCDDTAIEQRQIEITSWSPSPSSACLDMSAKLNQQLAFVLRSMGVPDQFFYDLLTDTRDLVLGAIGLGSPDRSHLERALDFVNKFKGMPQCEQIKEILEQNILDVTHPYIVRGLSMAINLLLNPIQNSFHMPVPSMKFLYGVPDPTGLLNYGECFVVLGDPTPGGTQRRFENVQVVVGRNPMQHPGDVRKLTAVFVQDLFNLSLLNVIVFPVKGHPGTGQLLNDEMSGGDFDGDQYIFIWNEEIAKSAEAHDPYPYYLDGQPLTKEVLSVAMSSNLDALVQTMDSTNCSEVQPLAFEHSLGFENSEKVVCDVPSSNMNLPSNVTDCTTETKRLVSTMSLPSLNDILEPNEIDLLQPDASLDPSKWKSDDVKRHFNNRIGICSEEAYEKLKLCAIGVLCHWDNVLGRLCNLQRDIADCSLHEAKMSLKDNPRQSGFADPECIKIAPLVARAVDSLKTGDIVKVPKTEKGSKIAEHWYKGNFKEGKTYKSSSVFGIISAQIGDLQDSVQHFVLRNSSYVVNSQVIDSMCKAQGKDECRQLVQKVRKRVDEEYHVLHENAFASHSEVSARSQQMTEGINRICKEQEEFVKQYLKEKGYEANLMDYITMFVGLLYEHCYKDLLRRSGNAYDERQKKYDERQKLKDAKDSAEDMEVQVNAEKRAERDSSFKWTLVMLPFKMFTPVLQGIDSQEFFRKIKSYNDVKQHVRQ